MGIKMTDKEEELIEEFRVQTKNKWRSEDDIELQTLKKSILKVARIIYDEEDPPKRCIAFSKNRKSIAFDIEMVPVVIAALKKLCPKEFLPEELRERI